MGVDQVIIQHYNMLINPYTFRHHWAPFWLTCGMCQTERSPDYVMKIETLESDIESIFEGEFGFHGDEFLFPKVKTLGTETSLSGTKHSHLFLEEYFGQLTKIDVLKLYEMYRLDFQMFDYSPELYLGWAK